MSQSACFKIVAALLLLAGACGSREHMNDDYGKRSRYFFAKQHVHAQAASGSPSGLDSEESAVIQANYREALGAEQESTEENAPSRVLLLRENPNDKMAQ